MDTQSKYIIESGHEIIDRIANETNFATDSIADATAILGRVIKETKGLLIVDFLDASDWDCLADVKCNINNNILTLYWRVPETDSEINNSRKMALSWDYLNIKFQHMRIAQDKNGKAVGIMLQGYSYPVKEARKNLSENGIDDVVIIEDRMFASELQGTKNGIIHNVTTIKTPVVSMWIIPKSLGCISAVDSSLILYRDNLNRIERILKYAFVELTNLCSSGNSLEREIRIIEQRSKVNIIRQEVEALFKLIVCYKQQHTYEEPIKKLTKYAIEIGDLQRPVLDFFDGIDGVNQMIREVVDTVNLYSHDSGNPILERDFITLSKHLRDLIGLFKQKLNYL